ncbi:MAG TPA: Fic family protein [Candidatus Acidoferrales bacterium]
MGCARSRRGRTGPTDVVSGPQGNEKIHFGAPAAEDVEPEMKRFFAWYEDGGKTIEPLIKAGLAHLYFVTIYPLEDGNGRITRAITEMSLARLENNAQRFDSMSSQIREARKSYYEILEVPEHSTFIKTSFIRAPLGADAQETDYHYISSIRETSASGRVCCLFIRSESAFRDANTARLSKSDKPGYLYITVRATAAYIPS